MSLQQDSTKNILLLPINSSYDEAARIQLCDGPIYCGNRYPGRSSIYSASRFIFTDFPHPDPFLAHQSASVYNPSQIYKLMFTINIKYVISDTIMPIDLKNKQHQGRALSEEESVTGFHSGSYHLFLRLFFQCQPQLIFYE